MIPTKLERPEGHSNDPLKSLWASVLSQAVYDISKIRRRERKQAERALWIDGLRKTDNKRWRRLRRIEKSRDDANANLIIAQSVAKSQLLLWIRVKYPENPPVNSLEGICELLDLNTAVVRAKLLDVNFIRREI